MEERIQGVSRYPFSILDFLQKKTLSTWELLKVLRELIKLSFIRSEKKRTNLGEFNDSRTLGE